MVISQGWIDLFIDKYHTLDIRHIYCQTFSHPWNKNKQSMSPWTPKARVFWNFSSHALIIHAIWETKEIIRCARLHQSGLNNILMDLSSSDYNTGQNICIPELHMWPAACWSDGSPCKHPSYGIATSEAEPCRPLPCPLNNPLVFVCLAQRLALIEDDCLHCRRSKRSAFHRLNLSTDRRGLLAHLGITEATQNVFLLQMATLWTGLNVGLTERERERETEGQNCISLSIPSHIFL